MGVSRLAQSPFRPYQPYAFVFTRLTLTEKNRLPAVFDSTDTTRNVLLRITQGMVGGFVHDRKLYALSSSPSLKPRLQQGISAAYNCFDFFSESLVQQGIYKRVGGGI